ncbi:LysR family transcriptional regulator [Furfurilactobacillus entadae]|uniref:LysR family transcriptional regulator n=1 Tax=Furfurilactobacillus entadae TaxID=2922307 RepID=UPI0035EBA355
MNTRDLAYFSALVELKNYTVVATRFKVSQPTITVAVQRLETEFGAPLVERDRAHNKLSITRAGILLYQRAQQILKDLDLAHSEVAQANQSKIRFGIPPIIGTMWFPLVVGELFSRGLLKYTETLEMGSYQLLKELEAGHIDMALLGSVRPLQEENLNITPLAAHPFRAVVSQNHPLAGAGHISFEQLARDNFVTMTGKFVHPQALKAYSEYAGFTPNVVYSTPTLSLIKGLVRANLGVSLLVDDAVQRDDGLVQLTLDDPVQERFNMSLVVRKAFLPNQVQQEFISTLFTLKELVGTGE